MCARWRVKCVWQTCTLFPLLNEQLGAAILETSLDFPADVAGESVEVGAAAEEEDLAGSTGTLYVSSGSRDI